MNKGHFRVQYKNIFLTYSQINKESTREEFLQNIRLKVNLWVLEKYVIAFETHKDGNLHCHAVIVLEKKPNIKSERYFDLIKEGVVYHPNIKMARPLDDKVVYVTKEDKQPLVYGFDVKAITASVFNNRTYEKILVSLVEIQKKKGLHAALDYFQHSADFLTLGKLNEGKLNAVSVEFDLAETIDDTAEDMKGILKAGQQIDHRHEGSKIIVADKKMIKNIMINLISNAVKFSEENALIKIRSKVSDGKATISVQDQGIGISEEDQDHLFSSFFRGKNAINIQGTGLGLHIVKRYLDLMGGSVELKSKLEEGTTVTLVIPVNNTDNGKDNSDY